MNKIYLLTDYLDRFESKHDDFPYRSGMDKKKLKKYFKNFNYDASFYKFSDIANANIDFNNTPIFYTSQEDPGYYYKSYIEDVIYYLELSGCKVIPSYKFLKANNNKVFMELLRKEMKLEDKPLKSFVFGTLEEGLEYLNKTEFPVVVKAAEGAQGTTVRLAESKKEFIKVVKELSSTEQLKHDLKEIGRSYKYAGYKKLSKHRSKYILQEYLSGLVNDWKVYVFGSKVFVFYRPLFKHRGFRASGGGYDNYFYGQEAKIPNGMLDYVWEIAQTIKTPFMSLDIVTNQESFNLLEYQMIYFGKAGILKKYSKEYFEKTNDGWKIISNEGDVERVYVESIVEFLQKKV